MRVVWSPSALQDITEIYTYVASYNPRAASSLIAALLNACDSLMHFPFRGRPVGDDLRELIVVNPYIVLYEIVVMT